MNQKNEKHNNHFFVLTGGPGVGKTSVINYLENQNMRCIKEVARGIIKEQLKNGGEALPWKNKQLYKDFMMDLSVKDYAEPVSAVKRLHFSTAGFPIH